LACSSKPHVYWISRLDQIQLLESSLRQDIIDSVEARGPCSVMELARELGIAADALYYHVRKLLAADLLVPCGTRKVERREEALYDVPGCSMKLRHDATDPRKTKAISRVIASMLRVTTRDHRTACATNLAVPAGRYRNLWARRRKAWVTSEQLEELNRLARRMDEILGDSDAGEGKRLIAHTLVVVPVPPKPPKRREKR